MQIGLKWSIQLIKHNLSVQKPWDTLSSAPIFTVAVELSSFGMHGVCSSMISFQINLESLGFWSLGLCWTSCMKSFYVFFVLFLFFISPKYPSTKNAAAVLLLRSKNVIFGWTVPLKYIWTSVIFGIYMVFFFYFFFLPFMMMVINL